MKIAIVLISIFFVGCATSPISDLNSREDVEAKVKDLFAHSEFIQLNTLENELLQSGKLSRSGYPLLDFYFDGLDDYFESQIADPSQWENVENKVRAWVALTPESPASHLALAMDLKTVAWKIRGHGYADTVSDVQRRSFVNFMTLERSYLLENAKVAKSDPNWFKMMLNNASSLSMPAAERDALLEEGLEKFPAYEPLYNAGAAILVPEWGGSAEALEKFLTERTAKVEGDRANHIYSSTYIALIYAGRISFEESKVDCERLVSGADQFANSFPTPFNQNDALYVAVLCRNRDVARRYVALVGAHPPVLSTWGATNSEALDNYARAIEWAK